MLLRTFYARERTREAVVVSAAGFVLEVALYNLHKHGRGLMRDDGPLGAAGGRSRPLAPRTPARPRHRRCATPMASHTRATATGTRPRVVVVCRCRS